MRCANSERGCQWTGTVGTLDNNVASCQFVLVPCPNKCEEEEYIGSGELLLLRKHLDQHLKTECPKRAYECPHCGEKGTFDSITEDHNQVCEKKIVACPNNRRGCSLSVEQGKTKEHVSSDCDYTKVACVYESLGCGVRMLRKDKTTHENEARDKHLVLCLVNIKLLTADQKTLIATVKLSEEKHIALKYSIALKDKQHKSLTEELNKLSKKNLTLTIKQKMLSEKYDSLSRKHETLLKQHKILSDTFKEHHKVLTRKEKFLFKLPHYASNKETVKVFFAPLFYIHPSGYKMCIRIDAMGNRDGKNTHVSVITKVLAGCCDTQNHGLSWELSHLNC